MLVLGEQTVTYHNGIAVKATPIDESVITAYGRVDDNGSRHLIGDQAGNLSIIVLSFDSGS